MDSFQQFSLSGSVDSSSASVIAISPTGTLVAAGQLGAVVIASIKDGAKRGEYQIGNLTPRLLVWSPDESQVAIAGKSATICFLQVREPPRVRGCSLTVIRWQEESITSLIWGSDGKFIFAASDTSNRVVIIEAPHFGTPKFLYHETPSAITCLAYDSVGHQLAIGTEQRTAFVFEMSEKASSRFIPCERKLSADAPVSAVEWVGGPNPVLAYGTYAGSLFLHAVKKRSLQVTAGTRAVTSILRGSDSKTFVSVTLAGEAKLWEAERGEELARQMLPFPDSGSLRWEGGRLYSFSTAGGIRADPFTRTDETRQASLSQTASAKVMLLGESNVGKSTFACMLAEGHLPVDRDQATTVGMKVWEFGVENLGPGRATPEAVRRRISLWDFGGQRAYRVIHQLFLDDAALALVFIDPTRAEEAMAQAMEIDALLERHSRRPLAKLLIGAKQDFPNQLVNHDDIATVVKRCGFKKYIEIGTHTGRNIDQLKALIAETIAWEEITHVSDTGLLEAVQSRLNARRAKGDAIVETSVLEAEISRQYPRQYEEGLVAQIIMRLASQGSIALTTLPPDRQMIVLQVGLIERYAGSIIQAAVNSGRKGLPATEEKILFDLKVPLPGIPDEQRLPGEQEHVIRACVAQLMVTNGICIRHQRLLLFPGLFPGATLADEVEDAPPSFVNYDVIGDVDAVFASLIADLWVSRRFGDGKLVPNGADFSRTPDTGLGLRRRFERRLLTTISLHVTGPIPDEEKDLFIFFVDDHLRRAGIHLRDFAMITCLTCKDVIPEAVVRATVEHGRREVCCPRCAQFVNLDESIELRKKETYDATPTVLALKRRIEKQKTMLAEDLAAKVRQAPASRRDKREFSILQISDFHFTKETNVEFLLLPLLADIRGHDFLKARPIEFVVLSGDFTDRGGLEGFNKARVFVSRLLEELSIPISRVIAVPGNHDVFENTSETYAFETSEGAALAAGAKRNEWVLKDGWIFFPRAGAYNNRFVPFSKEFFHHLFQSPYSKEPELQGAFHWFEEQGIQFLSFNSSWQIDGLHRRRASLNAEAVSKTCADLRRKISLAGSTSHLERVLAEDIMVVVFHHPLLETIVGDGPLSHVVQMRKDRPLVVMHGDIHEHRRASLRQSRGKIEIVGAGSFGAPASQRPEATPRMYNLIEVFRTPKSMHVHTRRQLRPDTAWTGFFEWENPRDPSSKIDSYVVNLE